MDTLKQVQLCWRGLVSRHGCGPSAAVVLEETLRAYAEPHRHYHTLGHIAALLVLLGHHGDGVADRDTLSLAILFHDVVYDPARPNNEAASAAWAEARLARLGFPAAQRAKVGRYILATQHDQPVDAADPDLALLLDLDLSILAAPPDDYRAYSEAIRREYAFVPDQIYCAGRRRVVEGFLRRERIYLTERLRAVWESTARVNLAAELDSMAGSTSSFRP
jgi:predicted metal-dependent HD superfamily phosphohydrolase